MSSKVSSPGSDASKNDQARTQSNENELELIVDKSGAVQVIAHRGTRGRQSWSAILKSPQIHRKHNE